MAVFIGKKHVEVLRAIGEGLAEREVAGLPLDTRRLIPELQMGGLITVSQGRITLTDAGKIILDAFSNVSVDEIPEVVVDSAALTALEYYYETGYIPREWVRYLEIRGLAEDGELLDRARKIFEAYKSARPTLVLTNDTVSFLFNVPFVGYYDDLITFTDAAGYGKTTISSLQAMRLLRISPPTNGRSVYVLTPAAEQVKVAITSAKTVGVHISVGVEEADALEKGIELASLVASGLQETGGRITEFGKAILEAYRRMTVRERRLVPVFVTEEEVDVLKTIKEIENIRKHTDILPEYSEIRRRVKSRRARDNLGEYLGLAEMKGLIERFEEKNKQVYRLTDWGRQAIVYGPVTTDAMKAVVYTAAGELPLPDWLDAAKGDGVIATGITEKGKFYMEISRMRPHLVYLTGYDVAVLARMPRKHYIKHEDLVKEVAEYLKTDDTSAVKMAISNAESKNLIFVLPNTMARLTDHGEKMKEVVESAKTRELAATKFAITPLTYSIAREMATHAQEINKLWKKAHDKRKDFYGELAKWLANRVRAPVDEVIKALEIMHKVGLLGDKSLTDAGKKLAEVFTV